MSFHEEEVLGKAYDAKLMRRLLRYLRPYKPQVAVALADIAASTSAAPWPVTTTTWRAPMRAAVPVT